LLATTAALTHWPRCRRALRRCTARSAGPRFPTSSCCGRCCCKRSTPCAARSPRRSLMRWWRRRATLGCARDLPGL